MCLQPRGRRAAEVFPSTLARRSVNRSNICSCFAACLFFAACGVLSADELPVKLAPVAADPTARPKSDEGAKGMRLAYTRDERGNRIPDFSHCGYAGGDRPIPDVKARVVVEPGPGDDTQRIQAAIDAVGARPLNADGFRGAVLLSPGEFEVAGQLQLRSSGVVLRGSGVGLDGPDADGVEKPSAGTTIVASGAGRRTLIQVLGRPVSDVDLSTATSATDEHVPVGATSLQVASTDGLSAGDMIRITRPSTAAWIEALGMHTIYNRWKPGTHDIVWDRVITSIEGNSVAIDAPITTAIERRFGGAAVQRYKRSARVKNVGIEDVTLLGMAVVEQVGDGAPHQSSDEDHAWFGVGMEHARDCWVRGVSFKRFAGGAVTLRESTSRVSVVDCISTQPFSEIGGFRRHTFFTRGQQCLFLRCWSEDGRHDFSAGHCAAGPNAFVSCYALRANEHSGPIESWSSAVLYDNVRIDGAGLHLWNAGSSPRGTGWAAANSVIWQSRASTMCCERPATANNWALGIWSEVSGDGTILGSSEFVRPLSLYQAQVSERLGSDRAHEVGPFLLHVVAATRPSVEQAADFVAQSSAPAKQLIDLIRDNMVSHQATTATIESPRTHSVVDEATSPEARSFEKGLVASSTTKARPVAVHNGWLTIGGGVLTGGTHFPPWWRGSLRPSAQREFGPSITRFAPGFEGGGFTDRLPDVIDEMQRSSKVAYNHHYGLWYDRRRDDHLMVRRSDGNAVAPFYEQPFARSGIGTAWDGLSKYDLTKYNSWYWQRLGEFAELCDGRGMLLFHHHYFQHNILEAGAHWADSPWRSANNINATDFPEPPPYISDKRIFQAHLFYDVDHSQRRALHRAYIRQCLENARGRSNVVHLTSGEFTGPKSFVEFWLDTIAEWQQETGEDALIALSCTKDVQDAILADPKRAPLIDIIDVRYWTYTSDGSLYAPVGGQNLAPRQHQRLQNPKPPSFASTVRSISEYRKRFPSKAVTYFANKHCGGMTDGWAVLMGGGSLAAVPPLPEELAQQVCEMQPDDTWIAADQGVALASDKSALIYCLDETQPMTLKQKGTFRLLWLGANDGAIAGAAATVTLDGNTPVPCESKVLWIQAGGDQMIKRTPPSSANP